jgi:hypothetical protein
MSNTTFGNGTGTYYNTTYSNETYGNGTFYNTTLFSDEDDPDIGQLMLPIIMGVVIVFACCIGACVCYMENKRQKDYREWVAHKKGVYV